MSLRPSALNLRATSLAAVLCLGSLLASAPSFASGGASREDSPPFTPPVDQQAPAGQQAPASQQRSGDDDAGMDLTTCRKGKIWNAHRKKCVRMHGEALPDGEMATYAYALAKSRRYQEALDVLAQLKNPDTATALNYRGYATRKLGRTDEGIGYYLRSVALDPNYAQVREYLGEAYVIKGQIGLAQDQLATIKTLCGTGCEPYRDLSKAIRTSPSL